MVTKVPVGLLDVFTQVWSPSPITESKWPKAGSKSGLILHVMSTSWNKNWGIQSKDLATSTNNASALLSSYDAYFHEILVLWVHALIHDGRYLLVILHKQWFWFSLRRQNLCRCGGRLLPVPCGFGYEYVRHLGCSTATVQRATTPQWIIPLCNEHKASAI